LKKLSSVTEKPKVTIGVCVRNCQKFVKDALDSIINQDFPHELMELILVDDGSEDETLSIAKNYLPKLDFPVKLFHTSWKGLGHARNVVVQNASGEYILWVDGDMLLEKVFVTKLVKFMDRRLDVGVAKGKQALEPSNSWLGTLETFARAASRMVDYESKKAQYKALGTGGAIYRVVALKSAGGFDENLRGYGEDADVEMRIRAAGYLLSTTDAKFLDYERSGLTWKGLWKRYWLRGYYTHYFLHKNKGTLKPYKMLPFTAVVAGLLQASMLYKLTSRKVVFLLPLQYLFKMTAYNLGYLRSHSNTYEPL
jgi:glycosyltransferase involved in cell wall biosynthesis